MKTSELTGAALDWAVAKCEDLEHYFEDGLVCLKGQPFDTHWLCGPHWTPSTDWSQGGAIIEREKIDVMWCGGRWCAYTADAECTTGDDRQLVTEGNTPLIAAMRGYVASKLGDEVELPEELA
jgi:hypothetical protein